METVTQTDLLHPELLPKTTLVDILEQRHIKLDGEQRENKEILVQIFLRTVTPQPQRQPRLNRRGQITAKVIKKLDMHKARSKSETEISSFTGGLEQKKRSQRGGLLMSTEIPSSTSSTSRLKPPPSVINKAKSIVKLTAGKPAGNKKVSESPTSPTSGVRKLAISPPSSASTTPKSTKLKVFNSSASSSKSQETLPKSGDKVTASSGNVSLKRPSTIENGEPMDTSTEAPPKAKMDISTEAPPKAKMKKISWP